MSFKDILLSFPMRLEPAVQLEYPNAPIFIYSGPVRIAQKDTSIECQIEIKFNWIPVMSVNFLIQDDQSSLYSIFLNHMINDAPITFFIQNLTMGYPFVSSLNEKNGTFSVTGWITPPIIKHSEKSIRKKAERILFHLFNFNDIIGENTRKDNGLGKTRLIFTTSDFTINVDSILSTEDQRKQKRKHGGYCLTHVGELISITGKAFSEVESDRILNNFGLFASFLSGIKCSAFFRTATTSDGNVWTEYNNYSQDIHVGGMSWLPQIYDESVGKIWAEFYSLCRNEYKLETLNLVIHWYLSANKNSGGIEGAIILLQNAFELLFRWIVVEQQNMLLPDGAEKLRASDKIRNLLDLIKCDSDLPNCYQQEFRDIIKKEPWLNDFPHVFTEVRNSYVHSNPKKRQKIRNLSDGYLRAILDSGLYYVELLLLYLLKYDGKIAQRTSTNHWRGGNEINVPWVQGNL